MQSESSRGMGYRGNRRGFGMRNEFLRRSVVSCCSLLAWLEAPAGELSAQTDVPPPKPPEIIDINTLSDGHHGSPSGDPTGYPLNYGSYPDTPVEAGGRVFFVAHDGSGERALYRYTPGSTLPDKVGNITGHPRSLTASRDSTGQLLYFVSANGDQEKVYGVGAGAATMLAFDTSPAWIQVDAITASSRGVEVIARTGATAANSAQALWRWDASNSRLTKQVDSDYKYTKVGSLVFVDTEPKYLAFSGMKDQKRWVVV